MGCSRLPRQSSRSDLTRVIYEFCGLGTPPSFPWPSLFPAEHVLLGHLATDGCSSGALLFDTTCRIRGVQASHLPRRVSI